MDTYLIGTFDIIGPDSSVLDLDIEVSIISFKGIAVVFVDVEALQQVLSLIYRYACLFSGDAVVQIQSSRQQDNDQDNQILSLLHWSSNINKDRNKRLISIFVQFDFLKLIELMSSLRMSM